MSFWNVLQGSRRSIFLDVFQYTSHPQVPLPTTALLPQVSFSEGT